MRTYSHDHGNFLPEGPNWTIDSLLRNVHCDHRFDGNTEGIPPYNLVEFSDRMRIVTRVELVSVLAGIPIEWPVTDEELEILGYFLETRIDDVRARLIRMSESLPEVEY